MKQSRSEKKVTMYVKATLKTRKIAKYALESGTGTGSQALRRNIVNNCELAVISTLRGKGRTVASKLVKEMARLCSIYHKDFRNLAS